MRSSGAVSNMNRSIGKPDGVSARVASISDLASADPNSLSSVGIRLVGIGNNGIACHATLHFANGSAQNGVLSFYDPGEYAPLQIQWISDTKIADDLARVDRLRTSKNLAVVPNLTSPSIQGCVGRALALGAGEQYPGQLWAACAQNNGSNLIPPTRASVNSSLDGCADKMVGSPEYAWAMAHPEARVAIGIAETGVPVALAFPGSPGTLAQTHAEAIYQTEAVALVGLYRQQHAQTLTGGSSETQAAASAEDAVKAAARIWCTRIAQPGAIQP